MTLLRPYLRDGVDVYVRGSEDVHFVFLATRKRIVLRVSDVLIRSLSWLDGQSTTAQLRVRVEREFGAAKAEQFCAFLGYLEAHGIATEFDWMEAGGLDPMVVETQSRQLSFLLDILGNRDAVVAAQQRIAKAKIAVFGVGAVGSWIIRILLGLGFRRFTLVDHDVVDVADVARHAFFDSSACATAERKVTCVARGIRRVCHDADVRTVDLPLLPGSNLDDIVDRDIDLVINAADEPYIGYTSVSLSRFCIRRRCPLLVAGGFDAHLGSLGELIVPGVTPCADCYAGYFKDSLADWVPNPHPVADRQDGFGGLCQLSVFSASVAAMTALRLFAMQQFDRTGGRGELLFDDYRLDQFVVHRRAQCLYCSEL